MRSGSVQEDDELDELAVSLLPDDPEEDDDEEDSPDDESRFDVDSDDVDSDPDDSLPFAPDFAPDFEERLSVL